MGNQLTCTRSDGIVIAAHTKSKRKAPKKKNLWREEQMQLQQLQEQEQAILAFALQQQQKGGVERAMSQRYVGAGQRGNLNFNRSSSARPRSLADPDLQRHEFLGSAERDSVSSLESKHFVLVHGGGYGAWCWYKSIALLEECGFVASALDLAGSGIEATDPNCITGLPQYAKPLLDFLDKLAEGEKVILVGHDFGGACLSYAMECHPEKISKAVFIAAAMVTDSQRAFDVFAPELMTPDDLLPKARILTYANGTSKPPTALMFDRDVVKDLFFNRSPAKDVALASVSLRPVPFAPVLERLVLTGPRYGKVRRYFVQTTDDNALTPALQERLIALNPPERVFKVKGSDHSPFFSKPQSLHKALVEIAHIRNST